MASALANPDGPGQRSYHEPNLADVGVCTAGGGVVDSGAGAIADDATDCAGDEDSPGLRLEGAAGAFQGRGDSRAAGARGRVSTRRGPGEAHGSNREN